MNLSKEEQTILLMDYAKYLREHARHVYYYPSHSRRWPMSFVKWWRTMADNAKDNKEGK